MAVRVACRVTMFEWIRCRDDELRALRVDPARRLAVTGHHRPLATPWLDSIGCWGRCETRDLIDDVAPHNAILTVSSMALRQFKSRWRLKSRKQWRMSHGSHAWSMANVCFEEHEKAERVFFDSCGVRAPVGLACEYAIASAASRWRARALGVLPIEMVLHVRSFHGFLAHHGLQPEDWRGLTPSERDEAWELGGAPEFQELMRQPASEHLTDGP